MLPIRLSKESREPIYHQVEQQLKALIAGGHLAPGMPLPSIRALSKDLGISVITIRRSYQNLEAQEFIETIHGKGTFVAETKKGMMEQVKISSVYESFEQAIQNARNYDYTEQEIEQIFREVMKGEEGQ
ncbi:GntR family transcriptional regulator [Planomicrobium sp. YIM 101495]|uniref:GntR family transcriptional regulator n=1 Tax=Planomicrobium sp. YIM 101495 TaxID=2665160 RepID=UPI0012B92B99|nr:GntR family transcriptional regulator [Planomicrobium sp. YIM 101495]MTD31989.1 GntR family transcriptional regulator [Planomicrobium sp. YIM 101495]